MHSRLLIILPLLLSSLFATGQTKEEIIKHKIYKVSQVVIPKHNKRFYTKYFDNAGRLIKEVETFYDPFSRSETTYEYADTFCIETVDKIFEGNKQVESVATTFTYLFDDKKRVVQKTITNTKGNTSVERYTYNIHQQPDSVFIYNNDTTVYENGNFLNPRIKIQKELSLKKIKVYSYPGKNKVLLKDCKYPIDNSEKTCNLIEDTYSDTLDVHQESFYAVQGCVENHFDQIRKWHKKKGLVYMFESSDFDDKTYYFYTKNQKSLIVQKKSSDSPSGAGARIVSTWKYYYRK